MDDSTLPLTLSSYLVRTFVHTRTHAQRHNVHDGDKKEGGKEERLVGGGGGGREEGRKEGSDPTMMTLSDSRLPR
jgi:hypothetical protein